MRVLTVFGTRPEVIKLAPVIRAIERRGLEAIVCASGQHRDMLDQMLEAFSIRPEFDLVIMRPNQSPLDVAGRIFTELPRVIDQVQPDWLVVQGDTTTTFAAAWVAFHSRVSVAHVEAGLRTQDKIHPFPEEINRRIAGVTADLHFAPTEWSKQNLLSEGIAETIIKVTGNTVIDALQFVSTQPEPQEITELITTKLKAAKLILVW